MSNPNNTATERARELSEQGIERTESTIDTAKQKAAQVADSAREMTSTAREKVSQATTQAADTVDSTMNTTGQKMHDLAQTVRQKAPEGGTIGNIAASAADVLDRSGSYLQETDVRTLQSDLEDLIRRRPLESLLIGAGVGFLLARGLRR
jgi:ElaB/YqjD/DUF883 family membrane-anchored ribosome-binding protein